MNTFIDYRYGPGQVDVAQLHALLSTSYWAASRPPPQIARAVRNSFCISAWDATRQVGFARLITDFATHAYLADVIVAPAWRGQGIATCMVRKLAAHEAVATCRITLHTRDAHAVYRPLGFADTASMVRKAARAWPEGQP
jgi:GNAT superfamily N-acetyltransferase